MKRSNINNLKKLDNNVNIKSLLLINPTKNLGLWSRSRSRILDIKIVGAGAGVGVVKICESESKVLCSDSTALHTTGRNHHQKFCRKVTKKKNKEHYHVFSNFGKTLCDTRW